MNDRDPIRAAAESWRDQTAEPIPPQSMIASVLHEVDRMQRAPLLIALLMQGPRTLVAAVLTVAVLVLLSFTAVRELNVAVAERIMAGPWS